jgi:hypothetical protein
MRITCLGGSSSHNVEKQSRRAMLVQALCRNPTLGAKCENATHTLKSEKMESSGTPDNLEDDLKGQISLPWCVLYINGKALKCRCPKWLRIVHLDICSPSYGQKKTCH